MKNRIIWKFLGAYIILILIAMLVLDFFVSLKLRDYYEEKITDNLKSNAFLSSEILKDTFKTGSRTALQEETDNLANKLNARITIVMKDGKVMADSEKDPLSMEDHSNRPEILEAFSQGFGESTRFSSTLGFNMKYIAVPININGDMLGTVRLALPLSDIELQLRVIYRVVLLGVIVAIVIASIAGYFISRSITKPITDMTDIAERISRGDFSKKAKTKHGDELGMLAKSLNRMADELQLKIENLKKLNMVRTDFIANITHELKTPLTAIKGFIETLEDTKLEDKENAMKFIVIIKKHTERISNIISDLLSLSELELGKDRVEKTSFDLKDLIDEVLLAFRHLISIKKHDLKTVFNGTNFNINADKDKIEQIFINLLDNAIKYTKDGGKITITLSEKENGLLAEVSDNGPGISREHLGRIFERFYRVDKARSRQVGGTGLGLAIVKHIVSLHDGKIDVESGVNMGTKVSIFLPKA